MSIVSKANQRWKNMRNFKFAGALIEANGDFIAVEAGGTGGVLEGIPRSRGSWEIREYVSAINPSENLRG